MRYSKLSLLLCAVFASASGEMASSQRMFPGLRRKRLAALQTHAEAGATQPQVAEESPAPQAPAVVPSVVDAGADGMPQLPAVSHMLSGAADTLKSVSSQASGLQARVVSAQMQSETKMARQKAAFEEKLKIQEQANQQVIEANNKIQSEIKTLQAGNAALKKEAKDIEKSNKLKREQLQTLEARLGVAEDFTGKSLTATDDSKSALLEVLHKKSSRGKAFVETASKTKRDDDDDSDDDEEDKESSDDDDSDDDNEGTSLLSVSRKVRRREFEESPDVVEAETEADAMVPAGPALPTATGAPSDILGDLAKEVAHLAQQEKESEKTLKTMFIRDYRAGVKRNKALLQRQKSLVAARSNLLSLEAELKSAKAHVDGTRKQLDSRLHGLGQFLQKLAHFSMSPQHDSARMGLEVPKAVVLKAE